MTETEVTTAVERAKELLRWEPPHASITEAPAFTITAPGRRTPWRSATTPAELFAVAKKVRAARKFDLARRLLVRAIEDMDASQSGTEPIPPELRRKIRQQAASCTEKDPDLPQGRRHELAFEILGPALREAEAFAEARPLNAAAEAINEHQETFGIAGAIHKRWWQADGQVRHLSTSAELYERGWRLAPKELGIRLPDFGYTGINAAYVLDLLATQSGTNTHLQSEYRERARRIREDLRERLETRMNEEGASERTNWWALVTLAEAHFGLRNDTQARNWLNTAKAAVVAGAIRVDRWEFETTARQLGNLAWLQDRMDEAGVNQLHRQAGDVLRDFLDGSQAALDSAFQGKVGLALSGGGFRASLFHIGVLARLAELDLLRSIEVISCVSGGSIIGALYYLRLRELLESKPDADLRASDYVTLVAGIEREFTEAIRDNPRMKVFCQVSELGLRTERMGELLDDTLYGPAAGVAPGGRPSLRSLKIRPPRNTAEIDLPRDDRSPFNPKYDNWERRFKVPILILNATTLNTGHNWQFTATFMGESPHQVITEVDANERLRRMYYDEPMPDEHRDFPLGRAVAASAAVPALFRPIQIAGLYPKRNVELVDGGVHDNQGVAGLLEQECSVLLISDASGQFVKEDRPSRSEISVLLRSNGALMARVRELEFRELTVRRNAGLIREFLFVHLKKDLTVEPVDWCLCDLPKDSSDQEGVSPDSRALTRYGVRGDIQNLLAGLRTDLDAFSEIESMALMASGYRMIDQYANHRLVSGTPAAITPHSWPFLEVLPLVAAGSSTVQDSDPRFEHFRSTLKLGGNLLFKGVTVFPGRIWLMLMTLVLAAFLVFAPILGMAAAVLGLLGQQPEWRLPAVIWLGLVSVLGSAISLGIPYQCSRLFDKYYLRNGRLPYTAVQGFRRP